MTLSRRDRERLQPLLDNPEWTNPNIGMSAAIAAAVNEWGERGEEVMRKALFHLGLKTGAFMLERNLIEKNCTPEEWGRFTMALMDLCGFSAYEEVESTPTRHVFKVLEYPYLEAFRHINAPPSICDIPGEWDRGCLQTINPRIVKTSPKCMWNGDPYCLRVHELREA